MQLAATCLGNLETNVQGGAAQGGPDGLSSGGGAIHRSVHFCLDRRPWVWYSGPQPGVCHTCVRETPERDPRTLGLVLSAHIPSAFTTNPERSAGIIASEFGNLQGKVTLQAIPMATFEI